MKKMTEDQIRAKIADAQGEMAALDAQIAPLQKQRVAKYNRIEKLRLELADRALARGDLSAILYDINATEHLRNMLPNTKQFYTGSYWNADEDLPSELIVQLVIGYKAEIAPETIEFIEKWVKISKRKTLDVLRHDCKEYYDINVRYYPDEGMWAVYDCRDYDWRHAKLVMYKSDDLKIVLEYIAKNHWYGEGPDDDSMRGSWDD